MDKEKKKMNWLKKVLTEKERCAIIKRMEKQKKERGLFFDR